MKACLNNDFSFYKRAFGFLKRSMQPEEEAFNQMLHLFLANQSSITHNLKTELHKVANVEELLLLVIHHCEEHVVATKYVLPNERFSLLRVIPYVMFLLDGEHCNVFSHKSVNWSRLKQLFKGLGCKCFFFFFCFVCLFFFFMNLPFLQTILLFPCTVICKQRLITFSLSAPTFVLLVGSLLSRQEQIQRLQASI